ncbi:uncharacterized protein PV07_00505 [Cladophialophora immunda]|uniref:Nuclear pore assembly and biogenesis-domain-containing protein n=1 Tax=Cladophialophora immunda TaxID=569365 RepID=A0A0D1ZZT8_9EURO|nr:uncharacterized protein PV07_00505 [Cladophialophora immunda]KIW33676.1 hypothetical protein PV07_00505 [Cladophialophora immunda]OQU94149.1 hypothetical protein CLAIMM_00550 [Cladophialophora immunda]
MPSAPPSPPPPLPSFIWHLADLYSAYILPRLPEPVQSLSNHLSPVAMSVASAASNGDIVSLAAFLLAVYLALKIADYIRRSVIGWAILLVKLALVLVLLNCVFYVNRYGWHKALADAEWLVGLVWGFVEDKVMNAAGDGTDNRTGWYAGGGSQHGYGARGQGQNQNPWGAYGGGRQQVPVGRGKPKGKSSYGWT